MEPWKQEMQIDTTKQNSDRLPDFIIIGSAKSGTTSLVSYLLQHPRIFISTPKEPCYFDENVGWSKGLDWYKSLFSEAEKEHICGEASTNYTRWPQVRNVPEKIFSLLPNVKLVYVMRNPVGRAYSHYIHRWTKEVAPGRPFEEDFFSYLKKDMMCIESSFYDRQIDQYLQFFPKDQLMLIVFEELVQNPQKIVSNLLQFLGITDDMLLDDTLPFENEASRFRYHIVRNEFIMEIKKNAILAKVINVLPLSIKEFVYDNILMKVGIVQKQTTDYAPPELSDNDRKILGDMLEESISNLQNRYMVNTKYWT